MVQKYRFQEETELEVVTYKAIRIVFLRIVDFEKKVVEENVTLTNYFPLKSGPNSILISGSIYWGRSKAKPGFNCQVTEEMESR